MCAEILERQREGKKAGAWALTLSQPSEGEGQGPSSDGGLCEVHQHFVMAQPVAAPGISNAAGVRVLPPRGSDSAPGVRSLWWLCHQGECGGPNWCWSLPVPVLPKHLWLGVQEFPSGSQDTQSSLGQSHVRPFVRVERGWEPALRGRTSEGRIPALPRRAVCCSASAACGLIQNHGGW